MSGTRRNNPLLAWHASPYDFDRFETMDEVSGKGQGAAAYGRGAAYLAENPKVSGPGESEYMKEFQDHPAATTGSWRIWDEDMGDWVNANEIDDDLLLADPKILDEGVVPPHYYARQVLAQYLRHHPDNEDALGQLYVDYLSGDNTTLEDTLKYQYPDHHVRLMIDHIKQSRLPQDGTKSAFEFVRGTSGGPYSYRVAAHIGDDTILDWDKKIKDHHPDTHQSFLDVKNELDGYTPFDDQAWDHAGFMQEHGDQTGQQFYRFLTKEQASDAKASKLLLGNGIHAIRYLDAGSREAKPVVKFNGRELSSSLPDAQDPQAGTIAAWIANGGHKTIDSVEKFLQDRVDAGRPKEKRYQAVYDQLQSTLDFLRSHRDKFEILEPQRTYNYVVFHPDFLEALEQYNIKGEKTKDFGPGAHLKAVHHDPFEGEDK